MSSFLEMSLEDIIQRKKKGNQRSKPPMNNPKVQIARSKFPISDARNKIISNKRNQITDAREKLAELAKQKDARLKLDQLRLGRQAKTQGVRKNIMLSHGKFTRTTSNKDRVFIDSSRQVVSQPLHASGRLSTRRPVDTKRFLENRSIEAHSLGKSIKPKPILRTVENDLDIIDDPMGEEYEPVKINPLNRKASLQLKIITHNNDLRENRTATVHRTAIAEKEKSPTRPPSILKKRPMAALRNDKVPKTDKPLPEYRIIVSNLRSSVTGGDIEELFGDVGGMLESRLVRPGTAEVIYKSLEDAQKAVDLYHNRQLDGQPMNCLLVTPRSAAPPPRSSTKSALYSTNSNVEPDISTFHKVLFSNL